MHDPAAVAGGMAGGAHAGLAADAIDPERLGTSLGAGTIGRPHRAQPRAQACFDGASGAVAFDKWGREGLPLIPPMWLLNHIPNMPACHISILNDCRGPNNTITQSDAASLLALGEAFQIIRHDRADAMLAGGADTRVNPISLMRNLKFGQLSTRNDDPERACRPFDRDRPGPLGEGSGFVVMETEHARARPRCGGGSAFASGMDIGCRSRTGASFTALEGGDPPTTSTTSMPTRAVVQLMPGKHAVCTAPGGAPVVAFKAALSNLGAAAGATELIASLIPRRRPSGGLKVATTSRRTAPSTWSVRFVP